MLNSGNKFATSTSNPVTPENNPLEMLAVPSEQIQRLLFALCSKDTHVRLEAREAIIKVLQPYKEHSASQPVLQSQQNNRTSSLSSISLSQLNSTQSELIYGLLRLMNDCPSTHSDTRQDCSDIIQLVKVSCLHALACALYDISSYRIAALIFLGQIYLKQATTFLIPSYIMEFLTKWLVLLIF